MIPYRSISPGADDQFFLVQGARLQGLPYHPFQLILVEGLGDVVEGALLHRVHGRRHRSVGRDHDDGRRRIVFDDLFQKTHPVEFRHPQVRHDHVHVPRLQYPEGLQAVLGLHDLVTILLQQGREDQPHVRFVVDDQDLSIGGKHTP